MLWVRSRYLKTWESMWALMCTLMLQQPLALLGEEVLVNSSISIAKTFWLQLKNRNKDVSLYKVDGKQSPADALTKYLDRAALVVALDRKNMVSESGRPASAPAAATL